MGSSSKRTMGEAPATSLLLPAAVTAVVLLIVAFVCKELASDILLPTDNLRSNAVQGGSLHRSQFPEHFMFGSGTSAYQVEGAAAVGGKGMSIWDNFTHTAGKTENGENGDVAIDQYHRIEEDLDLLAGMNMDSYRFSIAWTRILPNGNDAQVNMEGVAYYNRLIDYALSIGITPMVTLYHFDLPQNLEDEYGGLLSEKFVADFAAYAEACFALFGDRVKYWTTFNEPSHFLAGWGGSGLSPPGLTTNLGTAEYIAGHHVLLAHAAAADIYRRKFQAEQVGGFIGITVDCIWAEPMTNSTADFEAAERSNLFQVGWFLDPLYFGDYPEVMRKYVGSRLPQFSEEQAALLKGSLDFIGLNHYTARWTSDGPGPLPNQESSVALDTHVTSSTAKDGVEIGPRAASEWLFIAPWSDYKVLKWTSDRYHAPIVITESGMDQFRDIPMEDALQDTARTQYFQDYLSAILEALRDGVDVRGYYAWSLLDNFEWRHGYDLRFGLIYVDYSNGLTRHPKQSYHWFRQFLDRKRLASSVAHSK